MSCVVHDEEARWRRGQKAKKVLGRSSPRQSRGFKQGRRHAEQLLSFNTGQNDAQATSSG